MCRHCEQLIWQRVREHNESVQARINAGLPLVAATCDANGACGAIGFMGTPNTNTACEHENRDGTPRVFCDQGCGI